MKKTCRTLSSFFGALFLISQLSFAQNTKQDTLTNVTTIGVFDTNKTKSGYRINEYYVDLTESQTDSLMGKKVVVTGKLIIVKGINPNDSIIVQGSLQDRKFIIEPRITIIDDGREPLITK